MGSGSERYDVESSRQSEVANVRFGETGCLFGFFLPTMLSGSSVGTSSDMCDIVADASAQPSEESGKRLAVGVIRDNESAECGLSSHSSHES